MGGRWFRTTKRRWVLNFFVNIHFHARSGVCHNIRIGRFFGGLSFGSLRGFWKTGSDASTSGTHEAGIGHLEERRWESSENPLRVRNGIVRGRFFLSTDAGELRGRDPRRQEMDASADVLWDSEGCCQGVNGPGRMGQNGKLGHP